MIRRFLLMAFLFSTALSKSQGEVLSLPPFEGQIRESFENPHVQPGPDGVIEGNEFGAVFEGLGYLEGDRYRKAHTFTNSSVGQFTTTLSSIDGSAFVWSDSHPLTICFDRPLRRLGGYFGTVIDNRKDAPDGVIFFYDQLGTLVAQETVVLGNGGSWTWSGWELSSNLAATKVQVFRNLTSAGSPQVDGLQATLVPTPSSLTLLALACAGLGMRNRLRHC